MTTSTSSPTRGELERTLSQRIQALYANQFAHTPNRITCQIFDDKLAIIIENSITQPEQILINEGKEELAEAVRSQLDEAIKKPLKELIEEILNVAVQDLMSDATLETGRTGIIVVLSETPSSRQSAASSKSKGKPSVKGSSTKSSNVKEDNDE
ncbi:MAG: DUF2294 domain-containing protein [Scytonematopsis contorta HA4267-MV1]|jgi:uncharacterized protein YbcI|nr:DUF2294 domain-containing protein [Scytonematopsis contorta HA4267-MV1]